MSRLSQFAPGIVAPVCPAAGARRFLILDGFDATIAPKDLAEGCRRLGVEPAGAGDDGLLGRSLGVAAVGPDGSRSWVKVSALARRRVSS